MMNKISIIIAGVGVIVSLISPFIIKSDNSNFLSWNVLESLALLVSVVSIFFCILFFISKRRKKGSVYIAYQYSHNDFIADLKEKLRDCGYICYPTLSALIGGNKIQDLNIDQQIEKAEVLIVILSENDVDSSYITYIAKAFKKTAKPIQVYTFTDVDKIPQNLKSYLTFSLPEGKVEAIDMIVQMVNRLFLDRALRK